MFWGNAQSIKQHQLPLNVLVFICGFSVLLSVPLTFFLSSTHGLVAIAKFLVSIVTVWQSLVVCSSQTSWVIHIYYETHFMILFVLIFFFLPIIKISAREEQQSSLIKSNSVE